MTDSPSINVQLILDGDMAEFELLIDDYAPGIRAYFAANLRSTQMIDDLAQETFVAVYQGLHRFDPKRSEIGKWVFGIAKNKLLKHYRTIQATEKKMDALRTQLADSVWDRFKGLASKENLTETLRECIQALPERARKVITRRYFVGAAVQDIARDWVTTPDAISSLLNRTRAQLKRCVGAKV